LWGKLGVNTPKWKPWGIFGVNFTPRFWGKIPHDNLGDKYPTTWGIFGVFYPKNTPKLQIQLKKKFFCLYPTFTPRLPQTYPTLLGVSLPHNFQAKLFFTHCATRAHD